MPAGIEALCRPVRSDTFISAGELFMAAERLRMLWPLELLARRAAISLAGAWNRNARLFINCSPQVVSDPRFVGAMDVLLCSSRTLERERIVLEITERSDHRITPALARRVDELKTLGFEIALDDVGAGASGLNRIMDLRPHWLKLDMALVRSIHADPYRRNLIRAIVAFTADCDIKLVAEGVEQEAELEVIRSIGVQYAQGYHLSRPFDRIEEVPQIVEFSSATRSSAA
jgi:EAL domain-containing protein (putative c-di-GMP-specific phosphodiesterase class I)